MNFNEILSGIYVWNLREFVFLNKRSQNLS